MPSSVASQQDQHAQLPGVTAHGFNFAQALAHAHEQTFSQPSQAVQPPPSQFVSDSWSNTATTSSSHDDGDHSSDDDDHSDDDHPKCLGLPQHNVDCTRRLATLEDVLDGHCSACRRASRYRFHPGLVEIRRLQTLVKMAVQAKKHEQRVAARLQQAQEAMAQQLQAAGISQEEMLAFAAAHQQ